MPASARTYSTLGAGGFSGAGAGAASGTGDALAVLVAGSLAVLVALSLAAGCARIARVRTATLALRFSRLCLTMARAAVSPARR